VDARDFGTVALNANGFLVYQFRSVVMEEAMNFIINPRHPGMAGILIQDRKILIAI